MSVDVNIRPTNVQLHRGTRNRIASRIVHTGDAVREGGVFALCLQRRGSDSTGLPRAGDTNAASCPSARAPCDSKEAVVKH